MNTSWFFLFFVENNIISASQRLLARNLFFRGFSLQSTIYNIQYTISCVFRVKILIRENLPAATGASTAGVNQWLIKSLCPL